MSKNSRQIFLIFLAYYGNDLRFRTPTSSSARTYESLGATPQRAGLFLSAFYMVTLFCPPARQRSYGAAWTYGAR